MRITLLGTGTSTGIPVIGCSCPVCMSSDPRDKRLRTSAWIEAGELSIVIDTGPDFRAQALRAGIEHLDAVLFTHSHFDHVAGLDDVRPFLYRNKTYIPCYADPETARALHRVFPYAFGGSSYPGVPQLSLHPVEGPFTVRSRYDKLGQMHVIPLPAFHGKMPVLGFRIGKLAYLTDVSYLPQSTLDALQGLDVLVLDALREEPHPAHFTVSEAVRVAQQIGAKTTLFVHMTHTVSHAETQLPDGIFLGYDGLTLTLPDDDAPPVDLKRP